MTSTYDASHLIVLGETYGHDPNSLGFGEPVNIDAPYLEGDPVVGGTLKCTMGNWTHDPTSYSYAWRRDGAPIDATGESYVITSDDIDCSITALVTAQNADGWATSPPSNAVGPVQGSARSPSQDRSVR